MRQLILDSKLDAQNTITLTGKNYRYLVNVLRLKVSDVIVVRLKTSDNSLNENLVKMQLISINDKTAFLKKLDVASDAVIASQGVKATDIQTEMQDFAEIWLFQFLPQNSKMDLIVRQATECGVAAIVPIIGKYSKNKENNLHYERWNRIVKEARQQSGSPIDTKVLKSMNLNEALTIWQKYSEQKNYKAFVLHEDISVCNNDYFLLKKHPNNTCEQKIHSSKRLFALAVGSEGGFSEREFEILKTTGFCPIHFKTNVLRTETAALYGIAVVQQLQNLIEF